MSNGATSIKSNLRGKIAILIIYVISLKIYVIKCVQNIAQLIENTNIHR